MDKHFECPNCHTILKTEENFCSNCGINFANKTSTTKSSQTNLHQVLNSSLQQTDMSQNINKLNLKKLTRIKHISDKNDINIGKLCEIKRNESNQIIEITMTKKSLLKNYPKISFTKSDFLKVDSEKIWLNFTKEEFDKKIEKERLLMIEKQNKSRPKKRFMMLWGQGYEFG